MPKLTFGSQKPRIDIYKPGNTKKAELLFDLLAEYGTPLYPWQKEVLRRWLAEDEDGNFVNLECGLSVPRQNGKGEVIVARIIYGIIFRKATGLYTAQLQDSVDVIRKRVQNFFYENEHEEIFNLLSDRFKKKPMNYDFIEFRDGNVYKFKTRIRLSGLGNTNDEVINDEAAEMLDAHQSALTPTVSAAKTRNPQIIYAGTPPMEDTVGEVFARVRANKLSGGQGAWTEWSVENYTSKHLKKAWYKTNPSLGYSLLLSAIEAETSMSTNDFNRMRLGWWAGIEEKRAIKQDEWDRLVNAMPDFDERWRPVYAVKFSPDRSSYSLAAALPLKDERVHVEIVMNRPMSDGFTRIVKFLMERWRDSAAIIIDGQTGAPILYEELTKEGIPPKRIIQPTMKEVVAAHQFMKDAIVRQEVCHFDQPLLNETVRITKERAFGRYGGFGWDSMSKHLSTSAIDAVTYALWGQRVFAKKSKTAEDKKLSREKWNQILSNI